MSLFVVILPLTKSILRRNHNAYIAQSRDVKFNISSGWNSTASEERTVLGLRPEDLEMIVDEALKLAKNTIGPTNEEGDRVGSEVRGREGDGPGFFHKVFHEVASAG